MFVHGVAYSWLSWLAVIKDMAGRVTVLDKAEILKLLVCIRSPIRVRQSGREGSYAEELCCAGLDDVALPCTWGCSSGIMCLGSAGPAKQS